MKWMAMSRSASRANLEIRFSARFILSSNTFLRL